MTPKFLTSASRKTKLPVVRVGNSRGRGALCGKARNSASAMPNCLLDIEVETLSRPLRDGREDRNARAYGALLVC